MKVTMLTTVDNPFSPFDQFDQWFVFDTTAGYNTPGLLARIAKVSNELSDKDIKQEIERAIDEIVRENVSGVHRKVTQDVQELEDTPLPGASSGPKH